MKNSSFKKLPSIDNKNSNDTKIKKGIDFNIFELAKNNTENFLNQ